MLTLKQPFVQHDGRWAYNVFHGSYRMGMITPIYIPLGYVRQFHGWEWRITAFSAIPPQEIEICDRWGDDLPAATEDMGRAWQKFIDCSGMESGNLTLKPQPDGKGLANNDIYAGGFLLGRIYQQHSRFSVDWHWLITGLHGYMPGGAVDCEDAMAQIKAAWRSVYEQTRPAEVHA